MFTLGVWDDVSSGLINCGAQCAEEAERGARAASNCSSAEPPMLYGLDPRAGASDRASIDTRHAATPPNCPATPSEKFKRSSEWRQTFFFSVFFPPVVVIVRGGEYIPLKMSRAVDIYAGLIQICVRCDSFPGLLAKAEHPAVAAARSCCFSGCGDK